MQINIKDIGYSDCFSISAENIESLKKFFGLAFNHNKRCWCIGIDSANEIKKFFPFDNIIFDAKSIEKITKNNEYRQALLNLKYEKVPIDYYTQICQDVKLDPYQLYSALQMVLAKRCILALPVGKGKTLTTAEALAFLKINKKIKKGVIFTKSVCVDQIKNEILKNYSDFHVESILDLPAKKRFEKYVEFGRITKPKILVLNYEKVLNDSEVIKRCEFDFAVLDEVSMLKGTSNINEKPKSNRSCGRNIRYETYHIVKDMEYVYGLSATPVENNILELYNVYEIVRPNMFFGGGFRFRECFAKLNYWGSVDGVINESILNSVIDPFLITKKFSQEQQNNINIEEIYLDFDKKDGEKYLELQDSVKKSVEETKTKYNVDGISERISELTSELMGAHNSDQKTKLSDALNKLEKTKRSFEQKRRYEIMTEIVKLKKFCDFPNMVFPSYPVRSTKMDWVLEKVKEFPKDDKVLIFAEHVEVINRIAELFDKNNIKYEKIIGGTKMSLRDEKLDSVKNTEDCNIILSTDCLAYGKNIQFANRMILYSLPFNPAKSKQRVGRIDRRGQEKDVFVYIPLIKGSHEHKCYQKIQNKVRTRNAVVGFDMKISLSTSEFVQLLKNNV